MSRSYDAVVIGAGHNGLTCACYLADAGLSVLAVDQYHAVGGMTEGWRDVALARAAIPAAAFPWRRGETRRT